MPFKAIEDKRAYNRRWRAERRAAWLREHEARPTADHPKLYRRGCRCELCKAEHRSYQRIWRHRRSSAGKEIG